jgi:hypothetical protein
MKQVRNNSLQVVPKLPVVSRALMKPVVVVIWLTSLPPFPPTEICVPPVTPALIGLLQVNFV